MQLKTYKQRVRYILKTHPDARNNDGILWGYYINHYHPKHIVGTGVGLAVPLNSLQFLPSVETIGRCRRIIQNDNQEFIPTDPQVIKDRGIKEKNLYNAEVREAQKVNHRQPEVRLDERGRPVAVVL